MTDQTCSTTPDSGDTRASNEAAASGSRNNPSGLREELEAAAADLSYTSESDYPFRFFTLPPGSEPGLTALSFLNCLGISRQLIDELNLSAGQLIEEKSLDGFFPTVDGLAMYHNAEVNDPEVVSESERFKNLEAVLRRRLQDVKVFRVGMIEIRCYIAGVDETGAIAGLVTTSIET